MLENIVIKGAKENNLKNVDLTIPRNKLVVFTGVSGCGKSTLAFDTIFAEGQRRYVESLSAYARMFLGQVQKPNVESIEGLSPAISIDQKSTNNNPRSTVGTITEIYDYLRLLYARIGKPYCPKCGKLISMQSIDQIVDKVMAFGDNAKVMVMAPVIRAQKGSHEKVLEEYRKDGFVRVRIDGEMRTLDEEISLSKTKRHDINIVVDRIVLKSGIEKRLTESIEKAVELASGIVIANVDGEDKLFSTKYACSDCNISMPDIEPAFFSFNNQQGACPKCSGLGYVMKIGEDAVVMNANLSIAEGAVYASGWGMYGDAYGMKAFRKLAKKYNFDINTPYIQLPEDIRRIIIYGEPEAKDKDVPMTQFVNRDDVPFEGLIPNMLRKYRDTKSEYIKEEIYSLMTQSECPECHGKRLNPLALSIKIADKNIVDLTEMSIANLKTFFEELPLNATDTRIAESILNEINARLKFLIDVGLKYLSLSRNAGTLSGGESQRIRLATQIGSGLTGVVYILDEPSIGLHQRDNEKLLNSLKGLRDMGNSLIVVEHDEDTMREADYLVDIGPLAGVHGGEIVAKGSLQDIMKSKRSITGQYLSGERKIEVPAVRKKINQGFIEVVGAKMHNLKGISVKIPKGVMTCVTGVSGSGKSTLVNDILYPTLNNAFHRTSYAVGECKEVKGLEGLDKVIAIDQTPIGRTPRSNPATYTGVFTKIRELFASTPEAKERGFDMGRFSFNVEGGRCGACDGDGVKKVKMFFLPDVYVPCEVCDGKRYNREVLSVHYKGKNIYEVLEMTVEEALSFFENIPTIKSKLQTMYDVGLGYMKLGQPATTISGGEAQRLKLATELCRRGTGSTVYILDEPTTGLHMYDVQKLISVLQRFVDAGNTVIVIEHNLDVIKVADYIVDLGPEGGDEGGRVVAFGTPEQVAKMDGSYTGLYLNKILNKK